MQGKVALIIAERANTFAFVPAGCDDYHPLCRYNAASGNASGSSIGVRDRRLEVGFMYEFHRTYPKVQVVYSEWANAL